MFKFDPATLVVSDSERGLVLKRLSGGSDGTVYFKLVGSSGSFEFSAHMVTEMSADVRAQCGLHPSAIPMIWVVYNWDEEWKGLIGEAMLALGRGSIAGGKSGGINTQVREEWARAVAFVRIGGEYIS